MKKILTLSIIIFSLAGSIFAAPLTIDENRVLIQETKPEEIKPEMVDCPMDAKKCLDGSFVGRVAPDCEFEECPKILNDNLTDTLPVEKKPYLCTTEYDPVCGQKKVEVDEYTESVDSLHLIKKTYSNPCVAKVDNAEILYFGVCEDIIFQKNFSNDSDGDLTKQDSVIADIVPKFFVGIKKKVSGELMHQEAVVVSEAIVKSVQLAKTEEDRKSVFHNQIAPLVKAQVVKELEQENIKKEKVISKKSKEVFEKFDYFILKGELVYEKIFSTVNTLNDGGVDTTSITDRINLIKQNLELAQEHKIIAWLKFNMVLILEDKEEIKNSVGNAQEELKVSKEKIQEVFKDIKIVIEEIKNILNK